MPTDPGQVHLTGNSTPVAGGSWIVTLCSAGMDGAGGLNDRAWRRAFDHPDPPPMVQHSPPPQRLNLYQRRRWHGAPPNRCFLEPPLIKGVRHMSITDVPDFRAASPAATRLRELGPLGDLQGHWSGHGFNLIARPDFQGGNDFFLELNHTDEELRFTAIGGRIPNRGSQADDIEIFGVHYLQQIRDHDTGGALHLEPGVWLNVMPPSQPKEPATLVRLATIPHGSAVLAQGTSLALKGPPVIGHANTTPFSVGSAEPDAATVNDLPEYDLSTLNKFRTPPTPDQVTQDMVTNPNSVLALDIANQKITATTVLRISTGNDPAQGTGGGAQNIPFLQANANVSRVSATFWIETVQFPPPNSDRQFLQLQYTQTVLLEFRGRTWPHVTVATLKKVV